MNHCNAIILHDQDAPKGIVFVRICRYKISMKSKDLKLFAETSEMKSVIEKTKDSIPISEKTVHALKLEIDSVTMQISTQERAKAIDRSLAQGRQLDLMPSDF